MKNKTIGWILVGIPAIVIIIIAYIQISHTDFIEMLKVFAIAIGLVSLMFMSFIGILLIDN